jgi:translation initiation factor 1 (eIF-1/SUI1)
LKKVAKLLSGKYACGCSVVKNPNGFEEIDLQGDFIDDLLVFIPQEFPEVI